MLIYVWKASLVNRRKKFIPNQQSENIKFILFFHSNIYILHFILYSCGKFREIVQAYGFNETLKKKSVRFSGRTEKQAVRDALEHGRAPPNFKRTPSRRQPRRSFEEITESKILDSNKHNVKSEIKTVSIPQPAQV